MQTKSPHDTCLAVTLALTGIPASVGVVCLGPVLPLIEASYAHRPDLLPLVKYISVSIGLGMVIGAPIAGSLSDKIGRRVTLIVATLAFCLFGTAGYFVSHVPMMIALRAVAGAGAAAILTMGVALMGEHFEQGRRDRLIGLNAMCSSLAAIAVVSLSGFLGSFAPKLPFFLHLIPLPLVLLGMAYVPARTAGRKTGAVPQDRHSGMPWTMILFALGSGVIIFAMPVYLPFFMRDAGHANPVTSASVLALMSISAALYAAFYGPARTRLSIGSTFAVCLALFVLGCLILLFSKRIEAFFAASVLLGFGMAWVAPNLMSAANLLSTPDNRGRIVGLVKGANLSGSFVAVLLFDALYRALGASVAIIAMALFAAMLGTFSFLTLQDLGGRVST